MKKPWNFSIRDGLVGWYLHCTFVFCCWQKLVDGFIESPEVWLLFYLAIYRYAVAFVRGGAAR